MNVKGVFDDDIRRQAEDLARRGFGRRADMSDEDYIARWLEADGDIPNKYSSQFPHVLLVDRTMELRHIVEALDIGDDGSRALTYSWTDLMPAVLDPSTGRKALRYIAFTTHAQFCKGDERDMHTPRLAPDEVPLTNVEGCFWSRAYAHLIGNDEKVLCVGSRFEGAWSSLGIEFMGGRLLTSKVRTDTGTFGSPKHLLVRATRAIIVT